MSVIEVINLYSLLQHSFPDSIGDDLIVEVQGSKGECCGRVLAQVAAIADDPVRFSSLSFHVLSLSVRKVDSSF